MAGNGKSSLTGKDWVTLIFSASALLVSALSFYFTNVLIDDSAIVRLVSVDSIPGDASVYADRAHNNGLIVAKFAFANTGNRPAVLFGAGYKAGDRDDLGNSSLGHSVRLNLVLPPREVHIGEIQIPAVELVARLNDGVNLGASTRRFFVAFGFSTIDSRGIVHETPAAKALMNIDVTFSGWSSFRIIEEDEKFPTMKLFRNESTFSLWLRKIGL